MAAFAVVALAALADALVSLGASAARLYGGVAFAAAAPVALGEVVLNRYDLWPTALGLVALALLLRRRDAASFAVAGVGAAAKVFPALLVPVAAAWLARREGRPRALRLVGAAALAALAVALPFLALGPGGVRFTFSVQLGRGLQIESLGGSLLAAGERVGLLAVDVVSSSGSHNVAGGLARAVSLLLTAALLAVLAWIVVRVARGASPAPAFAASVVAFVALGKVLSPQFVVWLLPLAPLLPGRARAVAAAGLTLAAALLTNLWFPERYGGVVAVGPESWLVVARNAALLVLLALALDALRGSHASTPAATIRS
jgi:uncharacterized membrane protein